MRRGDGDIARYVQERTGVRTSGRIGQRLDHLARYGERDTDQDNVIRPLGLELPPGFQKGDGAQIFTPSSSAGYARYIGRAVPDLQAINLLWRVTTAGAAPTYAEWGLASDDGPQIAASLSVNYLSTIGYTSVASDVTGIGRKLTTIADFPPVNAGVHLWLIFVHQGATGLVLRGGVPQEGGFMLTKSGAARPSNMAANSQFDEISTSTNDLWIVVQQVQA